LRSGPFEGPAIVKPPALPGDTYWYINRNLKRFVLFFLLEKISHNVLKGYILLGMEPWVLRIGIERKSFIHGKESVYL